MVGWVSQYRQGARVRHIGYTTHTYPALIVFPPNRSFPTDLMSQSTPASSSSPNFQFVLNAALEAYEKTVKSKLLDHPLTTQLQSCDSPSSILSILTDLVQQLEQSRTSDERLRTWLDPTVNVLFAFSATLGEGVGLVILKNHYPTGIFRSDRCFSGNLTCESDLCGDRRPSTGEYLPRSHDADGYDAGVC
jgi:hypothetical protein